MTADRKPKASPPLFACGGVQAKEYTAGAEQLALPSPPHTDQPIEVDYEPDPLQGLPPAPGPRGSITGVKKKR